MPATTARQHTISEQEYLAGEDNSDQRHEYIDGLVYAMTGASRRHGLIVNAMAYALTPAARRRGCQLFTSDMKLRLEIGGKSVFYYPDLLLSCDSGDSEPYFCSTPCLIVEVLSESTARIDRREKLLAYQSLPSLQVYLLVEQDIRQVELYRRANAWQRELYEQGEVWIDCLEHPLPLAEIYADCDRL